LRASLFEAGSRACIEDAKGGKRLSDPEHQRSGLVQRVRLAQRHAQLLVFGLEIRKAASGAAAFESRAGAFTCLVHLGVALRGEREQQRQGGFAREGLSSSSGASPAGTVGSGAGSAAMLCARSSYCDRVDAAAHAVPRKMSAPAAARALDQIMMTTPIGRAPETIKERPSPTQTRYSGRVRLDQE